MAWRPNEQLIEGELDNTATGRVTGWMRFRGLVEPVTFHLTGDFHRDCRGAKLRLKNPPQPAGLSCDQLEYMRDFATHQTGQAGDITAGGPPHDYAPYPYIEWYSDQNGRVVLELDPGLVKVVGTPLRWQDQEPVSRKTQAENLARFMAGLARALGGGGGRINQAGLRPGHQTPARRAGHDSRRDADGAAG